MEVKKVKCQNCEQPYDEGFAFCPHCGQKTNDELTLGVLFYNTISNYFSFDARFLKSFFPLMFKPGYLAKKFLEGKRLLFLHPAQMYLFVSVIFFFILSFSTRKLVVEADKINKQVVNSEIIDDATVNAQPKLDSAQVEQIMDPLKKNQALLGIKDEDLKLADSIMKAEAANPKDFETSWSFNKEKVDSLVVAGADDAVIYKEMGMKDDASYFERRLFTTVLNIIKGRGAGSVVQTFFDTIPISMFFLLPVFAFIMKIFYLRRGRYSHHLVFSFYYFSFLFTVFSIIFGANMIWDIPDWIDWLVALSTFFYLVAAVTRFYQQHWFLSWFKVSIISFVFLLMVIPFAFAMLVTFSFIFN
ncbi:MAG: DUF3667 domain-containing protein [Bacteroidota bacterium]